MEMLMDKISKRSLTQSPISKGTLDIILYKQEVKFQTDLFNKINEKYYGVKVHIVYFTYEVFGEIYS